jgi:hypothetical protein
MEMQRYGAPSPITGTRIKERNTVQGTRTPSPPIASATEDDVLDKMRRELAQDQQRQQQQDQIQARQEKVICRLCGWKGCQGDLVEAAAPNLPSQALPKVAKKVCPNCLDDPNFSLPPLSKLSVPQPPPLHSEDNGGYKTDYSPPRSKCFAMCTLL